MSIRLVCKEKGHWESEDGRVMISLDSTFQTECDEPHPVRMRVDALDEFSPWYRRALLQRGTIKGKYLTYYCQGQEIHHYSQWTAMIDGEWTDDVYDRFSEAREAVEALVGPLTLVRRRA